MEEKKLIEEEERVKKFIDAYLKKSDFKLNPDIDVVDAVIKGLAKNRIKYERQYCPCRLVVGNKEKDREKICPCVWHKDEIEKDGMCHCRLFFKK